MQIDLVKEKNNFITVSDYSYIGDNILYQYNNKPSFYWKMHDSCVKEWIKVNAIRKTKLVSFNLNYNGKCDNIRVEYSIDNFNWITIHEGTFLNGEPIQEEIEFIFFRVMFEGLESGFEVNSFEVIVDEEVDDSSYISFFSEHMIPEKIREESPIMEDFIKTYLMMLEDNTKVERRLLPEGYFLYILHEKTFEGFGGMNDGTINQKPVNE